MAIMFKSVSYFDELKNVSFEIESGKIWGIVGSSNSGKSTLIDLMSGLVLPHSGMEVIGRTRIFNFVDGISYLNKIGVVYQDVDEGFLFDNILDEFVFTLKKHGIKNVNKKINESLKIIGFDSSYLKRSPFSLSLSEKKKLAFALAISFNPDILLLDEPAMGLDGKSIEDMIRLIRMMKIRYGKTVIIASKDTSFIHRVVDGVVLLNDGVCLKNGDKYEIFTDTELLKKCNLKPPKVIEFSNVVNNLKQIDLGYRDDINDLMKDIYRFVR